MIPKMSLRLPGNVKKGQFKLYGKLNYSILHFQNFHLGENTPFIIGQRE